MSTGCPEIVEAITRVVGDLSFRDQVSRADGNPGTVLGILRGRLGETDRELFDAEFEGLPAYLPEMIASTIVDAVGRGLAWEFESLAPDEVLRMARERAVEFRVRLHEGGVLVTMSHTLRHPTWLPAIRLPGSVRA